MKISEAKTCDQLVEKINKSGFFVTSIYQTLTNHWMCSLRPIGKITTTHGQGTSMFEALKDAWKHRDYYDEWDKKNKGKKNTKIKDDKVKKRIKRVSTEKKQLRFKM